MSVLVLFIASIAYASVVNQNSIMAPLPDWSSAVGRLVFPDGSYCSATQVAPSLIVTTNACGDQTLRTNASFVMARNASVPIVERIHQNSTTSYQYALLKLSMSLPPSPLELLGDAACPVSLAQGRPNVSCLRFTNHSYLFGSCRLNATNLTHATHGCHVSNQTSSGAPLVFQHCLVALHLHSDSNNFTNGSTNVALILSSLKRHLNELNASTETMPPLKLEVDAKPTLSIAYVCICILLLAVAAMVALMIRKRQLHFVRMYEFC
ncbi:hypothetical protein AeMF1_010609 [Aphanomyces euteiches]|nr:hypothetical protein AeMF1_010609 [Aphanomyces euteiches]KAH9196726.1 hypothetical protein AeNC1_001300 [Aphanomyces euteiches]